MLHLDRSAIEIRMTSPKTLAIKLRTLMPAHGFDQAELARRSGIRPNSISRYLAGLNMPRPGQLAKLAAALHVGVGELLAEHDAPPPIDGGSNLVRLTQSTASPHLVRLQVDQSVPGDVATRVVEILLQAQKRIGEDVLPPAGAHERKPRAAKPTAPAPDRYGSLADILLPRTPQQPEHVRQVLRLDGPPHRPPNGQTGAE